jgi:aryl-alcohol dehydrogenase-like predicted oxidoreductase
VGRALNTVPRSSVFVETKVPGCGLDGVSDASPEACANGTAAMLEANLKELNMSYVDLVLIHEPPSGAFAARSCHLVCDQVKAQWQVLQDFYEQRKTRAVGVSNYCYSCMECLDWTNGTVTPMVNQVEYHVGMGTSSGIHGAKGMKTFADAHGVVMQAYSALGGDDTFRKAIIEGELETEIAKVRERERARFPSDLRTDHRFVAREPCQSAPPPFRRGLAAIWQRPLGGQRRNNDDHFEVGLTRNSSGTQRVVGAGSTQVDRRPRHSGADQSRQPRVPY